MRRFALAEYLKFMTRKFTKLLLLGIIYLGPAILGGLFVLCQIFPARSYVLFKHDPDESTILSITKNSFALTPYNNFSRSLFDFSQIKIKVSSDDSFTATESQNNSNGQEIKIKKGFADFFYPRKPQPAEPPYTIKKFNNKAYLVTDTRKTLIPTTQVLKSYTNSEDLNRLPLMTEKEFTKLKLNKELAGFLDGTLIEYNDSVFIITGKKKAAFSSPLVFDNLNYDWDQVIQVTSQEARLHSNAPAPITLQSPHPNGTILLDEPTGNYYLVEQGNLVELAKERKNLLYSAIAPIKVTLSNLETRTCLLENNQCRIKPDRSFVGQPGNAYFFELPANSETLETAYDTVIITFTRHVSVENIQNLIRAFKQ